MSVVHVLPVADLVEHDETGGALCDCVCGPDIEFVENGALDGRETHEVAS